MYSVYIIESVEYDVFYIGQTNDLESRLYRHNNGYETYSKKYAPWKLRLSIEKKTRSEAKKLERKLKNLSRDRIEDFILKYG